LERACALEFAVLKRLDCTRQYVWLPSIAMSRFFVNYEDGRVATRGQLSDAGFVDDDGTPVRPWHPIQGPSDASTMWYVVMRKRDRGIFMGQLTVRHGGGQASLEERGWEEVPIASIGV
jgi:hypothetical protein